jgi:hypothetical protein
MSRRHGRNGRLYAGITSAGTAEPIAFLSTFTIDFSVDFIDVTALGDTTKTYVAGLPDSQGTFGGFWDDATQQLYTAASDGVARKFYLYADASNAAGVYWFGTALFDFSVASGVDQAVQVSGNWRAASSITKVG